VEAGAVTRASAAALALAAVGLAGCPRFHGAPLPGAPTGATFVDVDRVHVHYRSIGDGPAVVLLHGYGASLDSWMGIAEVLAKRHRVVAVDLKGFGWTSRPDGDYSPAAQATLVWHVLDKLGVADVAVVGHSWGSSVALAMTLAQPARVRRVALYDAYVFDEEVPGFFRWAQVGGLGELLFGLYYDERIDERMPLSVHDDRYVTQSFVDHVEEELSRPGTTAAALATARANHFAAIDEKLPTVALPVLLLWGADDQVTPLRFGERLLRELPRAELKVYPGCGHLPMIEARNPSTRDLVRFLAVQHEPAATHDAADAADTAEPPQPTATDDADDVPARLPVPPRAPDTWESGPGAALGELGAELTPRKYAAPRDKVDFDLHGYFRTRGYMFDNFDLDRGLDAAGQPLYPIPLGGGQVFRGGDLRLRTDLDAYAPGTGVAVHARVDLIDDVGFGATPVVGTADAAAPYASVSQRPAIASIKRGWGEVLTPFGVLAAGRMGLQFGLGMFANGGDCDDCEGGDTADRIAFASPIAGHIVAVAYDVSSSGPYTTRDDGREVLDLEPSDDVHTATAGILRLAVPATRARRAAAGRATLEYAAYLSQRWQQNDVPASYLPIATSRTPTANDLVLRDFRGTIASAWARISSASLRLEAEGVYATARVGQASLVPGAELTQPITSNQYGVAFESDLAPTPRARLGVDAGLASGDSAPGFNGPQIKPPADTTVDAFRFSPDYHVDQILFREIIGTVTDATYIRPHVRAILTNVGASRIEASAAVIASWAMEAASTPNDKGYLGLEVDPELRYVSSAFGAVIDYAVFLPGAAFDGTTLPARPAQALRVRFLFRF
jgi:uncharacterized protein (TIGR04551 family)